MSNDDVEELIARENTPADPPVDEVLDAQRDDAVTGLVPQTGPLDAVGADVPDPAMAEVINNTGDEGDAPSG
jgi:hypothetical protein